jgi:hypothetical protein
VLTTDSLSGLCPCSHCWSLLPHSPGTLNSCKVRELLLCCCSAGATASSSRDPSKSSSELMVVVARSGLADAVTTAHGLLQTGTRRAAHCHLLCWNNLTHGISFTYSTTATRCRVTCRRQQHQSEEVSSTECPGICLGRLHATLNKRRQTCCNWSITTLYAPNPGINTDS